jgi:hypothetical protein
MSQYVWWVKDGKLGVGSLSSDVMSTPSITSTLQIHYKARATEFGVTLTDTVESLNAQFPSTYSEVIVNRVLQKLSAKEKDFQSAMYYKQEFLSGMQRIRSYVMRGMIDGVQSATIHEF